MTNFITHTIEPWMPPGALKAKADYATIAAATGWKVLPLERYNDSRFDSKTRQQKIQAWLNIVAPGDQVIHQFPTYMSADFEIDFITALSQHHAQSALLIHDIEPLRLNKTTPWELNVLNGYDIIIVHSQAMYDELKKLGVLVPAIIQPFFDYLGNGTKKATFSHKINFAGTFQKSPWLKHYTGPKMDLFGSKPKRWADVTFPSSINYRENFDPTSILSAFHDGFGLLWDNDFEDKTYQTYTRFNAPHKASLYLRAGLPLIAWNQSAIGHLILQYNIGFVIESLSDLEKVSSISEKQYAHWQKNIMPLTKKLENGYFTKQTLKKFMS